MEPGLVVAQVRQGSLAAEMEIGPGDRIVRINGQEVQDLVDFQFLSSDEYLEVEVARKDGETWLLEIEKEAGEDFGVQFASVSAAGTRRCHNKCLFCFVDQMPKGMRPTLYEKDDDYRLSLTQGSFITLTNLSEAEFARIINLHLSPMYVSVHATDPEVRARLLGNPKAGAIMEQLKKLAAAGITVHTQVVLVPGINDGSVLEKTVKELQGLWPQVQSVAVVPVGLTAFREKLAPIKGFERQQARETILEGSRWQNELRRKLGVNFVYFSDEFYVEAGLDFPSAKSYDDFAQLENGVGISRLFIDQVEAGLEDLPGEIAPRRIHVITGASAGKTMNELSGKICKRVRGLEVILHVLENTFFGSTVTVTGLLTGQDLLRGLTPAAGELILIPRTMLRVGERVFLDDLTVEEVARRLEAQLIVTEVEGGDFLAKLIGPAQEKRGEPNV